MSRHTPKQFLSLLYAVCLLNLIFFGFWALTSTDHEFRPSSSQHQDQASSANSMDAGSLMRALGDTEIQLHVVHSGSVEFIETN